MDDDVLQPFEGENWQAPPERKDPKIAPPIAPRMEWKRRRGDTPDERVLIRSEQGKQVTVIFTPDEWSAIEHTVLRSRGLLDENERMK